MTELAAPDVRVGPLLRYWRRRRRLSQLDLALEAGVSARHLSFVETGRSRPSAEMVLHLAGQLDVPLRERNALLLAAGYAPAYAERPLDAPGDGRRCARRSTACSPATSRTRRWSSTASGSSSRPTAGSACCCDGVRRGPARAAGQRRCASGCTPRAWRPGSPTSASGARTCSSASGARRALTGDPALRTLLDEVAAYPGPEAARGRPGDEIAVPLRLRTPGGELAFLSTVATFGTAVDITVAELSIESFFPTDARTAEVVRAHVAAAG